MTNASATQTTDESEMGKNLGHEVTDFCLMGSRGHCVRASV